jgi:hypothetical protein
MNILLYDKKFLREIFCMSYLTINYHQSQKKKELNVISLQQIVGEHIIIDDSDESIRARLLRAARQRPDKYQINKEPVFCVLSPNKTNITFSGEGKSPWILLIGNKGVQNKLHLLFINNRIWGVELDAGMRMQRESVKLGQERLISFLKNKVESMINNPESWDSIEIYLRL